MWFDARAWLVYVSCYHITALAYGYPVLVIISTRAHNLLSFLVKSFHSECSTIVEPSIGSFIVR